MDQTITIRCTKEQHDKWTNDANSWGMNVSEYLRFLAMKDNSGSFESKVSAKDLEATIDFLRKEISTLKRIQSQSNSVISDILSVKILALEVSLSSVLAYCSFRKK